MFWVKMKARKKLLSFLPGSLVKKGTLLGRRIDELELKCVEIYVSIGSKI